MSKQKKINKVNYSLVIPLYNEELGVDSLCKRLAKIVNSIDKTAEVIFVNDGSSDKTLANLRRQSLPCQTTLISFSRNFGHQSAILAGLRIARGEITITLDGDLQHPPELIPSLLELHSQGFDIVFTKRDEQPSFSLKQVSSKLFYQLINLLSATPIPLNSSDFRSMNRISLNALLEMPEKNIFLRGMVSWLGFRSATISYVPEKRQFGESKYSLSKMFNLGSKALLSFSVKPLYIAAVVSLIFFILAALYAVYVIVIRFVYQEEVAGWASTLFVILVVSGFFSAYLTLLSLYISAIYFEVKRRPDYIISDEETLK